MTVMQKKSKLLDRLAKFELCLETPIIPGEMEHWTQNAETAFAEVESLLVEALRHKHRESMKQISQEDPELLRRVSQLKEQDRQSLKMLKRLRKQLRQLVTKTEIVEQDEARAEDRANQFIDDGLAFVIHTRTQETAMDTWLMEALERDRGVVD